MTKTLLSFVCLWMTLSAGFASAEINIAIELDTSTITLEDQLEVSVAVSGLRQAPRPQIAESPDYSLAYRGASSQMQIINGSVNSQVNFTYVLTPKKEGIFQVGPAKIVVNGKTYSSTSPKFKVLGVKDKQPEETYYYITGTVDNNNPYAGEQIVYTFRFHNRAQLADAELNMPGFRGFWKEEMGKRREFKETINGINWNITEIKMALFPERAGEVSIEPAQLAIQAVVKNQRRRRGVGSIFDDSFFSPRQTKRINLQSKPVTVKVKPIPKGGVKTNLVGLFLAKASLSKSAAQQGESVTLTVTLNGSGNVWDANLDQIKFKDIKVYADKPKVKKGLNSGYLVAEKEFKFALVPLKVGTINLPPITFHYFDTEAGTYKNTAATIPPIVVTEADEKEQLAHISGGLKQSTKQEVKMLGSDLMPPISDAAQLTKSTLSGIEVLMLISLSGLCPLLYIVAFSIRRKQLKIAGDDGYLRREKALSNSRSSLMQLKKSNSFFVDASKTIRFYVADRLCLDGHAITAADVPRLLNSQKFSPEIIADVRYILNRCDEGQYGGLQLPDAEREDFIKKIEGTIKDIEKRIK